MPNEFLPSTAPIWGLPPWWTIADLPSNSSMSIPILASITANTLSAVINPAARGLEFMAVFTDPAYVCDLVVLVLSGGSYVPVLTFPAISQANADNLFAGNLERVDLQGAPIKLQTLNTVNPNSGTLTVSARVTN